MRKKFFPIFTLDRGLARRSGYKAGIGVELLDCLEYRSITIRPRIPYTYTDNERGRSSLSARHAWSLASSSLNFDDPSRVVTRPYPCIVIVNPIDACRITLKSLADDF